MHRHFLAGAALAVTLAVSGALAAPGGGGGGGGFGGATADPNKDFQEGIEYLQAGDCKKAESRFKSVLKVVPKSPEANYYRAVAERCQGEHKSATRYAVKAWKYKKTMYEAYELAGISYLALGKTEDAQEQLDKLQAFVDECGETCPDGLTGPYNNLKNAMTGTPAGDQNSLLFEGDMEPKSAYLVAVELINQGRFEEAIDSLDNMTAAIGPHPDVMNYLGYAHRKLGYFDAAEGYYLQALALDPNHRGANEYLGELYVERREMDKARERLAVLERACPFGCAEYEDLKLRIESSLVAAD